jgi:hypothetical protein
MILGCYAAMLDVQLNRCAHLEVCWKSSGRSRIWKSSLAMLTEALDFNGVQSAQTRLWMFVHGSILLHIVCDLLEEDSFVQATVSGEQDIKSCHIWIQKAHNLGRICVICTHFPVAHAQIEVYMLSIFQQYR